MIEMNPDPSETSVSEDNSVLSNYRLMKLELSRRRREHESSVKRVLQLEEENSRLRAGWERISGECSVNVIQQTLVDVYKNELNEARVRQEEERASYNLLLQSHDECESKLLQLQFERDAYEKKIRLLESNQSECGDDSKGSIDGPINDRCGVSESLKLRNEALESELEELKESLDISPGFFENKTLEEKRKTSETLTRRTKDMIYEEIPSQNELQFLQQENTKLSLENSKTSRLANETQQQLARLNKLSFGDDEINLQSNDTTPSFGIKFGTIRGQPRLNQSNIVISAIDFDSVRELKSCPQTMDTILKIKVGDFVIRINGFNVQEASISQVRDLCNTNDDKIDLVLRKNVVLNVVHVDVEIPLESVSSQLGLQLGVFVKSVELGSKADQVDIMQMDELKKVNSKKVEELTLSQIMKSMTSKKHCEVSLLRDASISASDFAFWGPAYHSLCRKQQRQRSSLTSNSLTDSPLTMPNLYSPEQYRKVSIPGSDQVFMVNSAAQLTPMNDRSAMLHRTPNIEKTSHVRMVHSTPGSVAPVALLKTEFRDISKSYPILTEEYVDMDAIQSSLRLEPGFDVASKGTATTGYEMMDARSRTQLGSYLGSNTGSSGSLECKSTSPKSDEMNNNVRVLNEENNTKNAYHRSEHINDYTSRWVDEQGSHHSASPLTLPKQPQSDSDLTPIHIRKKHFESFGFRLLGGNKSGIFVSTVENYSPGSEAGVRPGMMLVQVNNVKLENVAYCFIDELMKGISQATQSLFIFKDIPEDQVSSVINTKPYDKFHVKSNVEHTASTTEEMSFSVGEILCVIDSHVITITSDGQQESGYHWRAFKPKNRTIEGLIPRQTRIEESADRKPSKRKGSIKVQETEQGSDMYDVLDAVRISISIIK